MCVDPGAPKMLAQCPLASCPLPGLYRVLNLVIRPASSPCLATRGLGDALQDAEGIHFLAEDDEVVDGAKP